VRSDLKQRFKEELAFSFRYARKKEGEEEF